MKIPKLAKGGIVQDDMLFIPNERTQPVVDILGKKYINIYNKTKNRRIKKKQIKKCPMLKMRLDIEKYLKYIDFNDVKIYINGKEVNKEEK